MKQQELCVAPITQPKSRRKKPFLPRSRDEEGKCTMTIAGGHKPHSIPPPPKKKSASLNRNHRRGCELTGKRGVKLNALPATASQTQKTRTKRVLTRNPP